MRLTEAQRVLIVDRCRKGASIERVARSFDVSASTIDRVLRKARTAGEVIDLPRGRRPAQQWHPNGKAPPFDIRPTSVAVVKALCEKHHAYGSLGAYVVYAFAVFEKDQPIAAFAWSTSPFGAAATICPEAPSAVLVLSRMVAVPHEDRQLRHISKPLRHQMRNLIDRTRWPVLVTYSDEGQGHTGHVYKCSGWTATKRTQRAFYVDDQGHRRSTPSAQFPNLRYGGKTTLQRWEHRACAPGEALAWLTRHGWRHVEISGQTWKSGTPASRWVR